MVKQALGNGDRSPNRSWRICDAGHRRGGDGDRASTSVYGKTCVTIISFTSNTQHRLDQVFGEPATILYKKCINIEKILEDCKNTDKVSDHDKSLLTHN